MEAETARVAVGKATTEAAGSEEVETEAAVLAAVETEVEGWEEAAKAKVGRATVATVVEALAAVKSSGLLDFTDDVIVVIQPSHRSSEERKICEGFSIKKVIVNKTNTLMGGGIDLIQK